MDVYCICIHQEWCNVSWSCHRLCLLRSSWALYYSLHGSSERSIFSSRCRSCTLCWLFRIPLVYAVDGTVPTCLSTQPDFSLGSVNCPRCRHQLGTRCLHSPGCGQYSAFYRNAGRLCRRHPRVLRVYDDSHWDAPSCHTLLVNRGLCLGAYHSCCSGCSECVVSTFL